MREEPTLAHLIKYGVPPSDRYQDCIVCGRPISIYEEDYRTLHSDTVCEYCHDEYIRNTDIAELMNYALQDIQDYRSYYYKEYHDLSNLELVKTILTSYEELIDYALSDPDGFLDWYEVK